MYLIEKVRVLELKKIDHVIDCTTDPDKTEKQFYIAGIKDGRVFGKIRFLCKYKIDTIKEQKGEDLQKILNTRNRPYYKRQKLDYGIEKRWKV